MIDSKFWIDSLAYKLVRRSRILQLSPDGDHLHEWDMLIDVEVGAIQEVITRYAITRKEPGATEAFDAYVAKRKAKVDPINEHAESCLRWAEELRIHYNNDLERRKSNMMKRMQSRFRRIGYRPEDVGKGTLGFSFLPNAPRLSNKRWQMMKPLVEPAILQAKNERQAKEREIVITKRKDFVLELYRGYKKSVSPLTWPYLPPHHAVFRFGPFAKLINALHDDGLDKDACEDAAQLLPREIEDWTAAKKRQLVSLLPGCSKGGSTTSQLELDVVPSSGTSDPTGTFQQSGAGFEALQLATSVFCCLGSNFCQFKTGLCLIGWEAVCPHLRCSSSETYWYKRLQFSQRGHDAATALVGLASLDPRTATATEMDRLDYRFICTSCPIVVFSGFEGREAYNWRDAVLHYIRETKTIQATHHIPTWSLLTADAEADIKRREEPNPYAAEFSWSCAHCPEHLQHMVSREEAITHVKFKHSIHTPVENTDFFYFITRDGRTHRRRVGFPQIPLSE